MKKLFSIVALISSLFSCTKQDIEQPSKPENNDQSITITVRSSGESKNDVLGYGYDALYAAADNINGIRNPIIDLDRYLAGTGKDQLTGEGVNIICGNIEDGLTHGKTRIYQVFDKSLDAFTKSIALNFNSDLSSVPWGSLQLLAEYDSTLTTKKDYSFFKIDGVYYVRRLYLSSSSTSRLKYFITDEFLHTLKSSSGEEILNKYGTHLLTDIYLGGRISVMGSAKDKSGQQNGIMKFTSDFFNAVQTPDIMQSVEKNENLDNATLTLILSGGSDIQTVERHIEANEKIDTNVFDHKTWLERLNTENAVLVGANKERLVFIWDLIDDPLIREKVYNAFIIRQQNLKGIY